MSIQDGTRATFTARDGHRILELMTEREFIEEGRALGHSLGVLSEASFTDAKSSYFGHRVFSVRDKDDRAIATIEVDEEQEIVRVNTGKNTVDANGGCPA
jgi:hypothetical protein